VGKREGGRERGGKQKRKSEDFCEGMSQHPNAGWGSQWIGSFTPGMSQQAYFQQQQQQQQQVRKSSSPPSTSILYTLLD